MTNIRSIHKHHHLFFLIILIHSMMFKVRWQQGRLLSRRTGHVEAYSIHRRLRHTPQPSLSTRTGSATHCSISNTMRTLGMMDRRQGTLQFSTTTTLKSSLSSSSASTSPKNGTNDHEPSPTTMSVPKVPMGTPRKFVAYPFQYHQELTIRIDSLTNMGWGIGRVPIEDAIQLPPAQQQQEDSDESIVMSEDHTGISDPENADGPRRLWVIMVPHVVVGELCVVRIFRNQKQYSEADLVQVLEPSPDRVTPQCSLAGLCGGCQYQHMSIQAQRNWKTKHVEEVLMQQKIEGYTPTTSGNQKDEGPVPSSFNVLPTLGTDQVYNYRSKITPHYDAPRLAPGARDVEGEDVDGATYAITDTYVFDAIGFQQSSNRNLVDVPECPIATVAINEKYRLVRKDLHAKAKDGSLTPPKKNKKKRRGSSRSGSGGMLGATLLFRQADDDAETGEPIVITDHNQYMKTTVKGITFQYLAGNFFQNNNYVLPLMVDAVIEAATQPVTVAGDRPTHLIDCYCGSGLFALSAASHFELCVGIEVNEKAIGEATNNAQMNDISNCQFMAASAEAIFTNPPTITLAGFENQRVQDFPRDKTVVVLDPPRKGCSEEFLAQLYDYSPQRIVYMSCGPSTQARDAKGIVEIGGYEIVSTQPFDLFPQTKHIECLMIFEKKHNR